MPSDRDRMRAACEASADLPWTAVAAHEGYVACAAARLVARRAGQRWMVSDTSVGVSRVDDAVLAGPRLAAVLDAADRARATPEDTVAALERRVREALEAQAGSALDKLREGG